MTFAGQWAGAVEERSGTAYAAAIVTGATAWLLSERPDATAQQVIAALRSTAKAPGGSGSEPVIQIAAAIREIGVR